MTDAGAACTYLNRSWYEFTGQTPETCLERDWFSAVHPDDRPAAGRTLLEANANRRPFRLDYRLRRRDGEWRWAIDTAAPRFAPDGTFLGFIGSVIDITDRKNMEDALRRANHDLEQFAYSASHDLQEPLRSVSIYSELFERRYGGVLDGPGRELLHHMRNGAARMQTLIQDLLAYSQVTEAGTAGPELVNAGAALETALLNLAETVAANDAKVISEQLPDVPVESLHLQQLFQNLVGNAIKYRNSERPPVVHVAAEMHDGQWLFSVRDNGIGIEAQHKDRIFGLFKRLHTGKQYSGTGLGLAICQRIVERYHGRIWVESEPGKGSTFFFTLPSHPRSLQTVDSPAQEGGAAA
jgi:PAS domain S-box-containing protein